MKNSRKQALPLTRVSFVALEENKHEVEVFQNKWKNIVELSRSSKRNFY